MRLIFCTLFSIGLVQGWWWWWSMPENLGIVGSDDVNPQACRAHLLFYYPRTCVVWQSDFDGNWDIFSRFSEGGSWSDILRITNGSYGDVDPSVAYDYTRSCFWCVWQYEAPNQDIYISQGDAVSGWLPPYRLTDDLLDDRLPSIRCINDTVWVVWTRGVSFGDSISYSNIYSCYYGGTSWSIPTPLTDDSTIVNWDPKINVRYNHPFVVWERAGDIYYSEYLYGSWQTPQPITDDPHEDINPEIASESDDGYSYGIWVVWQTNRDGNYEIYLTGYDSLDVHYRKTFHDSADITPSPLFFWAFTRQGGPPITALSTNRNGNYDIYVLFSYWQDTLIPVDTSSAHDILPVTSGEDLYVWVLWQTDRHGEWDIYGSYTYVGGVEESHVYNIRTNDNLTITPNPFSKKTNIKYSTGHSAQSSVPEGQKSSSYRRDIELKIYNVNGRLVRQFDYTTIELSNRIVWDGTDDNGSRLPGGIFFIQLRNQREIITKKIVFID